jgi:hypothetical protein
MPMPTEEEIKDMYDFVPSYQKIIPNYETILERLLWVGPVPRHLFVPHTQDIFKTVVEPRLSSNKRKTFLKRVVLGEATLSEGSDDEVSYVLVHVDSPDLSIQTHSFASDRILKIITDDNATMLSRALLHWISKPDKTFAAAMGNLFDAYGHELFVISHQYDVYPLVNSYCIYGKERIYPVPGHPFKLDLRLVRHIVAFEKLFEQVTTNVYYVHKHANIESADCFVWIGETLYILQFTVSDKHPVKGDGLAVIIRGILQSHGNIINEVCFIFVTPNREDGLHSLQPLHAPGTKSNYKATDHIPAVIRQYHVHETQYVMRINRDIFQQHLHQQSLLSRRLL